jgi:AraC family transcriptional regulator
MLGDCGWNVGKLAKSLGVGRRTFARVVEQSLGITGKVWLRQIRMVAACHMLREDCKITSLAHSLRFRDVRDFAREFKKMVGVSPSFYRKAENARC